MSFPIAELHTHVFLMPESAFTVMAMTSGAAATSEDDAAARDVIVTGAPPGVGPIEPGDSLRARISRLDEMEAGVR
jgi:hypothetical protein